MRILAVAALALVLSACGPNPPSPSAQPSTPMRPPATAPAATPSPGQALPDLCPPVGSPTSAKSWALPDVTLHCLGSDDSRNVRDLAGRPMVVNFWASWCGPCRVELPLLARADRDWGDRVAFVGIDVQDASAEAWKALTKAGVGYPQLEDPRGRTRGVFGWQSGLPITVFVDESGRMVDTERAPFRTYPEVAAALRRHLGGSLRDVGR